MTASNALDLYLERIDAVESDVEAFIHLDRDKAREAAASADPSSPLAGLPIGVKDLIDTGDQPTCYGSKIYAGNQPVEDSAVVARAREAGGVILGKTVTTEFAWRNPGRTKNPNNLAHTPGGSSSGSAAAVAAGMMPFAFGTQTAGSVIRPAAYCGIVGFKPTFGTHDRRGVKPLSNYLDTVGTMAQSVEDVAWFDYALRKQPMPDLTEFETRAPRIAIHVPFAADLEDDQARALEVTREAVQKAGGDLSALVDWTRFEEMDPIHETIMKGEAGRALAFEFENHFDQLVPFYQEALAEGRAIADDALFGAQARADAFRNEAAAKLDSFDAILTSPAPGAASKGLESTGDPRWNRIWTMLRWPCVTVPVLKNAEGLPLGVQIVTGYGEDAKALQIAAWIEKALANR